MLPHAVCYRDGANAKFIRKLRCFFQVPKALLSRIVDSSTNPKDKGREFGSLSVLSGLNTDL
jgi:hypothetical protein